MSLLKIIMLLFWSASEIGCPISPGLDPFIGIEFEYDPSTNSPLEKRKFQLSLLEDRASDTFDNFDDVIVKPDTPRYFSGFMQLEKSVFSVTQKPISTPSEMETKTPKTETVTEKSTTDTPNYHTGFIPLEKHMNPIPVIHKTVTQSQTSTEGEVSSPEASTTEPKEEFSSAEIDTEDRELDTNDKSHQSETQEDENIKDVCSCFKKNKNSGLIHSWLRHHRLFDDEPTMETDPPPTIKHQSKIFNEEYDPEISDEIIELPRGKPKLGSIFDLSLVQDITSKVSKSNKPKEKHTDDDIEDEPRLKTNSTESDDGPNLQQYIIDGISANKAQFPSAVMVTRKYKFKKSFNYRCYCSATLIDRKWVVTAGHCVYDTFLPSVILGSTVLIGDSYYDPDAEIRDISKKNIFLHPNYKLNPLTHDIALFKLDKPVKFNDFIQPADLPEYKYFDYVGLPIIVTGFGSVSLNDDRYYVELNYLENFATDTQICQFRTTGDKFCCLVSKIGKKQSAACFGDSGGGCYRKDLSGSGAHLLIGVNSAVSNTDCTGANTFVRLSYYLPWIKKITGLRV